MSIGFWTIVSLSADVTLAIIGVALVFLVLWQDARRRSNRAFAACMMFFSVYGVLNLPFRVAQQFDVNPDWLVHVLVLVYVLGMAMLVDFLMTFAGVPRRMRRRWQVINAAVALVFGYLALTHAIFTDYVPLSSGSYNYSMTTWGYFGVAFATVYLGLITLTLFRHSAQRAREITLPGAIVIAGLLLYSLAANWRSYAINSFSLIVMAFMLGRVLIRHQVFQPLADLNETLAQKNDELLYATQAKAQFLANMSHELRTPLNSIIGYTELVSEGTYGELSERQRDRLQKVMRNGRLLLELINDVLDLSKLEAGRVELELSDVDTNALLDALLRDFEGPVREKGLSLVRAYSNLPALRVDIDRARQILANVLSNAVRFTEQGVVIVRGHADASRQQIVLSVTDTGPGIETVHHEHVFEAFQQAEGTLVHGYDGTGLGLAIARRLTLLHGGNLWFETVVGEGTTFHIALPAAGAVTATPESTVMPRRRGVGPVILVVDDDHEAVELLQDQLESQHYRVYGAYTVNSGLQMARTISPALIILDIAMPDIDGWHVLEVLRSDPVTSAIPVIIVSAADAADTAREVGVEGFIAKPVQVSDLLAQVDQLVPHRAGAAPAVSETRSETIL